MSDKIKLRTFLTYKFHLINRWNLTKGRLIILFILITFSSCIDDNFSLGKEYLKGNMRVLYLDTCTAVLKTVWEDSIRTSNLGVVWAGRYFDKEFDSTTTTVISYLPFSLPSYTIQEKYEFDSINFSIRYASDYYGDTSIIQNYSLFRLKQAFSLDNINYNYSNDSVAMEAEPLIKFRLKPRHTTKRLNTIGLPGEFGKELLDKFMKEDKDVKSSENFTNYFSGFALVPDMNDSSLISGFSAASDSSIYINLYYHYYNPDKQTTAIVIVLDKSHQFNQVKYDRAVYLKSIGNNKHEINSYKTGNKVFIQGLTGLSMEMEFPYLKSLNLLGDNVGILGVNLILKPVKGSYDKKTPLPDSLSLVVLNQADDNLGKGGMRIYKDEINYGLNTDYEIDITSFYKDQLSAFGVDRKRLKIGNNLNSMNGFLRRVIIGNEDNEKGKLKIELKLIIYAD